MVHGFLTTDLFPHAPLARLVKLGPIFFICISFALQKWCKTFAWTGVLQTSMNRYAVELPPHLHVSTSGGPICEEKKKNYARTIHHWILSAYD